MDWLRQLPIGQYVAGGGWLRQLDPRLKFLWSLAFLLTPVLAGSGWRLALVVLLLALTFCSGIALRVWQRSLPALLALSLAVGLLAAFLPSGQERPLPLQRPPVEQKLPAPPAWVLFQAGPLRITKRSAELGLNTASLLFTVMHSANLLLVSTPPEELAWGISALLRPLERLGVPVQKLGFQLLLALRFVPLVQEELQNLTRGLATRALNLRQLGWKQLLGLVLALGERLLANVLLRAEQGAEALLARSDLWRSPAALRVPRKPLIWLDGMGLLALLLLLALRMRFGSL
jgi:energy-coupling factor transport system permease protein